MIASHHPAKLSRSSKPAGLTYDRPSERRQGLAMGRVETPLVVPLKRHMTGNENAGLEDADLIGKNMNVEDAAARRVRHAVEITTCLRGRLAFRA
jgi:hypothetical protein